MKIVIAGAGEVGSHLAKMLSQGSHDITVIESDPKMLDDLDLTDVVRIEADCTTFAALKKASVRKADLFIAVNHTETKNIISAMLAKQLGTRTTIARIDNNEYMEQGNREIFFDMGIDHLFYPEKVAAHEVINLLGHTATTEYVDFSGGKLSLVVFKLDRSSAFTGNAVGYMSERGGMDFRTVAIERGGKTIIPHSTDTYADGDTIYIITTREAAPTVMGYSGKKNYDINNLMIIGGSRIGVRIAAELENELNIKLIESDAEKAYRLAETLDKTLIINEDGHNIDALMEEGFNNMDALVAVTGEAETNILIAMLAKRMGVKKVIAEVENMNYINLAESIGIDTIINKKLITASSIFRFTMNSDVQAVKYLTGSQAEVLEFIVKPGAPATKKPLEELGFPAEAIIGGVVRGERVFIADKNTRLESLDRVVVFALPKAIGRVGKFFN